MSLTYQIAIVSHGRVVYPGTWYLIPSNTVLHTVPKGSELFCYSDKVMEQICSGRHDVLPYHYIGPTNKAPIPKNYIDFDVYFSDEILGRFKTGIFVCNDGKPTLWMAIPSYSLRETLTFIHSELEKAANGESFVIHVSLLACMGDEAKSLPATMVVDGTIINWSSPIAAGLKASSEAHAAALAAAAARGAGGAGGAAGTGGAAAPVFARDPRHVSNRIRDLRGKGHSDAVIKSVIVADFGLSEADADGYLARTRGGKRKTRKTKRRSSRRKA
jgi:hypothetical protein